MKRITGSYEKSTTLDEEVLAFVPLALPPAQPAIDLQPYAALKQKAEMALARLAGMSSLVPSSDWLLYSAIRKEALLSSQMEGTQATIVDLLDEEAGLAVSNTDDVEEVSNYIAAYKLVRENLRDPKGLPISTRLLCEAHKRLLQGVRGRDKQPGELRRSQNWIGGTRPGNAVFVPPPAHRVAGLLSDLEKFIHQHSPAEHVQQEQEGVLPVLIVTALVHAQFETIHPFLDGNGRIGRLLIAALLEDMGVLPEPLLYLSAYLKQHQSDYYRLLSAIRSSGDWESWIAFFLEAVSFAASEAESSIVAIASLIATDRRKLLGLPHFNAPAYKLFELLPTMPRFTVERVCKTLETTFPTANTAIKTLADLRIVNETTGNKRNRSFSYSAYINLLS